MNNTQQQISNNQPMPRGGARPGSGRPPLPPGTAKTETFIVRCTPDQKTKLAQAWETIKQEITK